MHQALDGTHAAVFTENAQGKLTFVERQAFQARLASWQSTLDGK